jgi:hydroxyacylglutathione hydrolase
MTVSVQIHTIVSAPFDENTYVVWPTGQRTALVIDPGLEPDLILRFLRDNELTVAAILNTHGHSDHIGGNTALKEAFPNAPLIIGTGDAGMLTDAWQNLSAFFGFEVLSPPADRVVTEGDAIELAGLRLEVREVPGHSPGHVVFLLRDSPCLLFGGDVLFRGGVGRTDFPGGSTQQLLDGIRGKLYVLPLDTVVYPGHGPVTTVGHERRTNPFVRSEE